MGLFFVYQKKRKNFVCSFSFPFALIITKLLYSLNSGNLLPFETLKRKQQQQKQLPIKQDTSYLIYSNAHVTGTPRWTNVSCFITFPSAHSRAKQMGSNSNPLSSVTPKGRRLKDISPHLRYSHFTSGEASSATRQSCWDSQSIRFHQLKRLF